MPRPLRTSPFLRLVALRLGGLLHASAAGATGMGFASPGLILRLTVKLWFEMLAPAASAVEAPAVEFSSYV